MDAPLTEPLRAWPVERVLGLEFHLQSLTLIDADAIHVYETARKRGALSRDVRDALHAHEEDHEDHVEEALDLLEDLGLADVDPRNPSPLARSAAERIQEVDDEAGLLRILVAYETFSRRMHRTIPLEDVPPEVTRVLSDHAGEEAAHREALEELLAARLA